MIADKQSELMFEAPCHLRLPTLKPEHESKNSLRIGFLIPHAGLHPVPELHVSWLVLFPTVRPV